MFARLGGGSTDPRYRPAPWRGDRERADACIASERVGHQIR
ncbi:hypothetical protein ACFQL4_04065 [Halosimplex aquaticum]